MKTQYSNLRLAVLLCVALTATLHAQNSAFTYQGLFEDNGSPANGTYDFVFTLYDSSGGATVVGEPQTNIAVAVVVGLFLAEIDFGANVFDGSARWLAIGERTNGGASFTPLTPRQRITSAPYAVRALSLGSGALSGFSGHVSFSNPANSFTGDGSTLTGIHSLDAADGSPADAVFVDSEGRVGVGTNMPSDALHVIGAIRSTHEVVVQNPNNAEASARYSWLNDVARVRVGGSGAGSGAGFDIQGVSDISLLRVLQSGHVGIGTTTPSANLEIVDASDGDAALSVVSPGGATGSIHISSPGGVPGFIGVANNTNRRDIRFTDQGIALWTSGSSSSPPVGNGLVIDQVGRVGIGTTSPSAALHVTGSFIAGHPNNSILAGKFGGVIAGGGVDFDPNEVRGDYASVLGGTGNLASGDYSVAMGSECTASGYASTAFGNNSVASGSISLAVGSGAAASGIRSIALGHNPQASGDYSMAIGREAHAQHPGSFVWADSQNATIASSATNSVAFRCSGGVRFTSGVDFFNQTVSWAPGAGSWSFSSDRNLKENFQRVDVASVVEKVCALSITEWNYQGYEQRHIGPMAQDFHAAFPLNESDTTLNDADLHGVALAAIQGLNNKLEQRLKQNETEITELRQQLSELRDIVTKLSR